MRLRNLLSKRLRVHAHLVDPSLPNVSAAAEDGGGPRGFVTPSLGTLVSVAGLAMTLIGGYTNLRSSQQSDMVEMRSRIAALERQRAEDAAALKTQHDADQASEVRQFTGLRERFNAEVVGRPEIDARFGAVQAWQTQVNGLLLAKAGR